MELIKIPEIKINKNLQTPIKIAIIIDELFSVNGGIMPSCITMILGASGIDKTTVCIEILKTVKLQNNNNKVLLISIEMNKIHLYRYSKRLNFIDIFIFDTEKNIIKQLTDILHQSWGLVLIDSFQQLVNLISVYEKTSTRQAEIIPYKVVFEDIDKVNKKFKSTYLDVQDTHIKLLLNETEEIKIEGYLKESFTPNIGLSYSYGRNLNIIKVIERITYTNQVTTSMSNHNENNMNKINTTHKIIQEFSYLQNNEINEKYIKYLHRISNVKASLIEYETTKKLLSKFIDKNDTTPLNKLIRKNEIGSFIKKEYLLADETSKTTINAITDFASHNYVPLHEQERYNLQTKAFDMLYSYEPNIMKFGLN